MLIGAGDVAFLRTITVVAAVGAFAPLNLAALHWRLGIGGVWAGLTAFILVRFVGMVVAHPGTAGSCWVSTGERTRADRRADHRGQTGRLDVARRRRPVPPHRGYPARRACRNTRSAGHRRAGGGCRRATRLLHHLVLADKAYSATIRLGEATVTDDATGQVLASASAAGTTVDDGCR